MRKLWLPALTITAFSIFATSCAKSEPSARQVEYAQACDAANNGQVIAVQGFLGAATTTPCQKTMKLGKDKTLIRECAFKLLDKVNVVGTEIMAYLPEGKESNQVETPDAGLPNVKPTSLFSREKLKIRLDDGSVVVPQEAVAAPVTLTGELSLTDKDSSGSEKICSIHATKVEKR